MDWLDVIALFVALIAAFVTGAACMLRWCTKELQRVTGKGLGW